MTGRGGSGRPYFATSEASRAQRRLGLLSKVAQSRDVPLESVLAEESARTVNSLQKNRQVRGKQNMAHKLVFEPSDKKIFELIHDGYHALSRASTREEHKINNRILDKLEEISTADPEERVVPGYRPDDAESPRRRFLKDEGGFLIFEDAQFAYLKKVLEGIQSAPALSRHVEAMWEFLDGAKSGDAKALAKAEEKVMAEPTLETAATPAS